MTGRDFFVVSNAVSCFPCVILEADPLDEKPTILGGRRMNKHVKRVGSLVLTMSMLTSAGLMMTTNAASTDLSSDGLRSMEYLDRGLVAAETADGIFLSWRFLATSPTALLECLP